MYKKTPYNLPYIITYKTLYNWMFLSTYKTLYNWIFLSTVTMDQSHGRVT